MWNWNKNLSSNGEIKRNYWPRFPGLFYFIFFILYPLIFQLLFSFFSFSLFLDFFVPLFKLLTYSILRYRITLNSIPTFICILPRIGFFLQWFSTLDNFLSYISQKLQNDFRRLPPCSKRKSLILFQNNLPK